MSDLSNIGHALLIVGCLYFGYAHGFEWWLILLILFGICTWTYAGFTEERKKYYKTLIEYYQAKTAYFKEKRN